MASENQVQESSEIQSDVITMISQCADIGVRDVYIESMENDEVVIRARVDDRLVLLRRIASDLGRKQMSIIDTLCDTAKSMYGEDEFRHNMFTYGDIMFARRLLPDKLLGVRVNYAQNGNGPSMALHLIYNPLNAVKGNTDATRDAVKGHDDSAQEPVMTCNDQVQDASKIQSDVIKMIIQCADMGANDIHIDSMKDDTVLIRARVKGNLVNIDRIPADLGRKYIAIIYNTLCDTGDSMYSESEFQDAMLSRRSLSDKLSVYLPRVRVTCGPSDNGPFMVLRLLWDMQENAADPVQGQENTCQDTVKGHNKAVAAFTVGVLSLILSPLLMGIVGIILSIVGLNMAGKAKAMLPVAEQDAARMAYSLSVIGGLLSLTMLALCLFVLRDASLLAHILQ